MAETTYFILSARSTPRVAGFIEQYRSVVG